VELHVLFVDDGFPALRYMSWLTDWNINLFPAAGIPLHGCKTDRGFVCTG